jgi:hypothetical protein
MTNKSPQSFKLSRPDSLRYGPKKYDPVRRPSVAISDSMKAAAKNLRKFIKGEDDKN